MLKNREGQKIPDVTFKVLEDGEQINIKTDNIFMGKSVVVFCLPGAYTPTCSSTHVPRYVELFNIFKENGIDSIVCIAVNDAFVMSKWEKEQSADKITFLADGNGQFAEKMGMLVDKSSIGLGLRSWRYSMLVKDGLIEKMFIEPEKEGDPLEVSDADTILNYINPNAQKPEFITMITKEDCPYCIKAKKLLNSKKINFEEVPISRTVTTKSLRAIAGEAKTPRVFSGGKCIGGLEELEKYINEPQHKFDYI